MESNVLCIDEVDMDGSKTKTLGPKLGGPEVGVEVGVGVDDDVDVGVGVGEPAPSTSRPFTRALSLTVTNWMVMVPVVEAVALNCSISAISAPPAVAKTSKLVSTWLLLMLTLKGRLPAPVQYISAECSRTVEEAPAVRMGMGEVT